MKNTNFPIWEIVKSISLILGLIISFAIIDDYLDKKIENKITNTKYIEKLSHSLRPYLIFDQYETILYNHGALSYIDSIKVRFIKNTKKIETITVYLNQYLNSEPLLEPLGPDPYEAIAIRGKGISWIYILKTSMMSITNTPNKFRLEILK